ncbi:MAG: YeeE/YedE thiosulfate transporter family protein [Rhodospirillales bacterium]
MTAFTPVSAALGGALIGLSAVLLMYLNGRIAGIAGIAGGVLRPAGGDVAWRVTFAIGLVLGVVVYRGFAVQPVVLQFDVNMIQLVIGGFLVGFGSRLGSGCTRGLGVCGLARLSPRSLAATAVFLAVAVIVVYVTRHLIG